MGDLIYLFRYKNIDTLLQNENAETRRILKIRAFQYFSDGNIEVQGEILREYGSRFENSALTVEHGNILLIYNNEPYFICKTEQRLKKEKKAKGFKLKF